VTNLYGRRRRLPILVTGEREIADIQHEFDAETAARAREKFIDDGDLIDALGEDTDIVDLSAVRAKDEKIARIKGVRAKAERQAVNSPIQGGASDTNFLAAGRISCAMDALKLQSRMVLTVYDSLIYNVKPEELDTMLRLVHTEMLRETQQIKVRLDCEIKIGRVWGKLEEVPFSDDHVPNYSGVKILQAA
jgi:DNA polymerase I-like protein with 3'-5' exonuclease and polymerase domains